MRLGLLFRFCALLGCVEVTTSMTKAAKRKAVSRKSRQVFDGEPLEGVWTTWGEWSGCSQTCGVGVSHRSRKCLPPPPSQNHLHSLSPPNWAGYQPGRSAASPANPPHQSHHFGLHPHRSPSSFSNLGHRLSLYVNSPDGEAPPVPGQSAPLPPFHQPEFPPANSDSSSAQRSPYYGPPRSYNTPRVFRRPTTSGAVRASAGGSRRSAPSGPSSREVSTSRRPSSIRPGQFGYGKVPFSLSLHRPSRQVRHTPNGTDNAPRQTHGEVENIVKNEEQRGRDENEKVGLRTDQEIAQQELSESPAAERRFQKTTTDSPHPRMGARSHTHSHHGRGRAPSRPPFSRSASSSRQRFDWSSVTAPPPPGSPFPRSRSSSGSSPFASPFRRPNPAREHHPSFNSQASPGGDVYPLQLSHASHLGVDSSRHSGRSTSQLYKCFGPKKEYRRCFSQVCAGGVTDARAEQCAAFNTQEFISRFYNWEPFTEVGEDKQCELTCKPAGYKFYVRLAERVRDGTPCFNTSSNDVCVEGQCLTEGCDGVLGSTSVIDRCGVCGGRDSSCRRVAGSFQNVTVPLGYHKILDIPAGARLINITERRPSSNYLALRSGAGASVVNGGWAVDPPGEHQAGGTTFTYSRPRAQSEGAEEKGESLRALGPTTTQLQLYIIFHKDNPGIDYEFYIPLEKEGESRGVVERKREPTAELEREKPRERESERAPLRSPLTVSVEEPHPASPPISGPSFPSHSSHSSSSSVFSQPSLDRWTSERNRHRGSAPNRNARIPPRTDLPPDTQLPFVWRRGGLTQCSASCGKGFQHRVIMCINRYTDEEVPEMTCDSASKPVPEEEPCNVQPCPPFWEVSAWSECSVSCGPGVQQRQLQCRQSFGNRSTMVHPQRCANLTPPPSTQACQMQLCSRWEVGSDWSTCSVDCGMGKRTRSIRCVSDQGSVVNDDECNTRSRPQGSEDCNMGPCVTNWYFSGWSNTCSAQCGTGVQKREVVCLTRGGVREGEGGGDCVAEKPAEMKACNNGPCVPTFMWFSSPWTKCNVPCGEGSQRRDVICIKRLGNDFTVEPVSECAHLEKPTAVQECQMGECQSEWFTTEWSACSRSCGRGLQVREVRCLAPDKSHSQECDFESKPEQEQACNTIPCGPQVADKNCRDRRDNCMMVVQARMCVYPYYKTACCASCTQSAQRAKRQ